MLRACLLLQKLLHLLQVLHRLEPLLVIKLLLGTVVLHEAGPTSTGQELHLPPPRIGHDDGLHIHADVVLLRTGKGTRRLSVGNKSEWLGRQWVLESLSQPSRRVRLNGCAILLTDGEILFLTLRE